MVSIRVIGTVAIVLFSLTGCSYKILNKGGVSAHKVVAMNQNKFMPTIAQIEAPKTKVVVFNIEDKAPKARSAGAGQAATGSVERYIIESGNVELVDRNAAVKLQKEIALIEMGTSNFVSSGPAMADYAVMGEITSASTSSFYWPQGKPGKMALTELANKLLDRNDVGPPEYEYTAKVKGAIKVFQLPNAQLIKTFDLDDDKSLSKPAGLHMGPYSIGGLVPSLSPSEENSLVMGASTDAVETARHELKNFFSKKGYILEKRISTDGKDTIFLVSFGVTNGAKEGDEVEIYTLEESTNPITGKKSTDETLVGKAKVADIIKSNECWIHIADKTVADRIQLGDYVKVNYSKGFGDYAKGVGKFMF